MTALVFGWVGTLLILSFNIPQVWRTCVLGHTAGVPTSRAWVAIAVATLWLGYGLAGGGVIQVVLNGATITLNVLLLAGLRATAERRGLLLVAVTAVLAFGLVDEGGKAAIGLVGAVVGAAVYVPQLLALRRSGPVDGVSRLALHLQLAGGACWLLYGGLREETVVWAPNVVVILTTAWTILLLPREPIRVSAAEVPAHA